MQFAVDSRIGTELHGYRLDALVGRGGMGVVYRAHDPRLKRDVALKLLASELAEDGAFRERFLRESELAAGLEHPNVVPIHDVGEVEAQLFVVMRLVEEGDLKALLAREGTLEARQALALVSQVASALDAAHERGLVHRDVKPSNVLVDGRGHAYLSDFGLSRRLSDQAAGFDAGLSLGTPAYVAPEQIEGKEIDGRADQYSLACVLYECLAGERPFPRSSEAAVLFAHLEEAPPTLPGLEEVLPKALAKDPADRFGSCTELVDAAANALGITVHRRSLWPLAVAVVGLALIGASLAAFFLTRGGSSPAALPGADSLVRIDPTTNTVRETIPVGRTASAVAVDGGHVWVTSFGDGNVWRINPKSKDVLRVPTRGSPTDVAAARGKVLVANGPQQSIVAFDADGNASPAATLGGQNNIGSLRVAAGPGAFWFADPTRHVVGKVQPELQGTDSVVEIPVPQDRTSLTAEYESFDGFAFGEGAVWVTGDALGHELWRIDPATNGIAARIPLPFVPAGMAAGEGAVWVTSLLDDTVVRVDPATNRILGSIRVGRGASSVATGNGAVWVANSIDGTVSRIDPATSSVTATIPVGGELGDIDAGPDTVWVTAAHPQPVEIAPNAIPIGVLSDCKGRYAWSRNLTLAGTDLALIDRGGKRAGPALTDGVTGVSIAGHPIRLVFGCSDTTTGSALSEARRLVDRVGVRILIGPLGGNQGLALQDFARRRPNVAFVNGTSSAQLLDPAPNFFSFHSNGAAWTAGLGTYAFKTLGWRKVVVVGDLEDDVFNWTQAAGFVAEFCSLGGTVEKRIWVPPGTQDYSTLLQQVPASGTDGFFFATYPETVIAFARAYPGLRGNIATKVIAGTFSDQGGLKPLKKRVRGLVGGGAIGPGWHAYMRRYRRSFPKNLTFAGGYFDIYFHDAMAATLDALAAVGGDLSNGERPLMAALARVRLNSALGPVRLDEHHQAIAFNYVFRDGRQIRSIPGVDRTFGGSFAPTDPPPTRSTPVCVKRTPPPWAR
jgi:YVTN family beta-propeller protein